MEKKLFICNEVELKKEKFIIKFFEELKDEVIIFFDRNNKINIYSSICPHFGGEIFYDFQKDILKCKWHGWKFCKNTGKCLTHPIKGKLNLYNFEINPNKLNNYLYTKEKNQIYILYE